MPKLSSNTMRFSAYRPGKVYITWEVKYIRCGRVQSDVYCIKMSKSNTTQQLSVGWLSYTHISSNEIDYNTHYIFNSIKILTPAHMNFLISEEGNCFENWLRFLTDNWLNISRSLSPQSSRSCVKDVINLTLWAYISVWVATKSFSRTFLSGCRIFHPDCQILDKVDNEISKACLTEECYLLTDCNRN